MHSSFRNEREVCSKIDAVHNSYRTFVLAIIPFMILIRLLREYVQEFQLPALLIQNMVPHVNSYTINEDYILV